MKLPRFLSKLTPGFKIKDMKEWLHKGHVDIYLERKDSSESSRCHRCHTELSHITSTYPVKIQTLPIFNYKCFLYLKRRKGFCENCKKIRSEQLDFICPETPHLTRDYGWWLGRMCEIAPVSRVGELAGHNQMTMWRMDFARMRRMFQYYKIPKVKKISVDEVYARSKRYHSKESRDKRFFTIISDLETRRVIWVSESRNKQALDEFFKIIGRERCQEIEVVAMDQHDPYKASVEEFCPQAMVVWDRFHVMQTFNDCINEERKLLHDKLPKGELKRLTRGKFKSLFLKKKGRRNREEERHLKDILKENEQFVYLELIKEGMYQFFNSEDEQEADKNLAQIGRWIFESEFKLLWKWFKNALSNWKTLKNYFKYPVTSSLSEGINNVIKTVKKRAYGYRNMAYFKLKILQVCGFLNSRYVPMSF